MAELISYDTQRLEFETFHSGDTIQITSGQQEAAWRYDFSVEYAKHWPEGTIIAVSPSGEESLPMEFSLHGCGRWTSRRENPVQKQERAFTPYYDGLIVGNFLWGRPIGDRDRIVMDKPGQEISGLVRVPYRENAVYQVLSEHEEPVSVRQVMATLEEYAPPFSIENLRYQIAERDVRSTLKLLIEQKRIQLLKGKVQRFDLIDQ